MSRPCRRRPRHPDSRRLAVGRPPRRLRGRPRLPPPRAALARRRLRLRGAIPPRTEAGPAGLPGAAAQTLAYGADLPGQWWTLFHSSELDQLVAEALHANPDLDSARAALKAAQASLRAERGGLLSHRRDQRPGQPGEGQQHPVPHPERACPPMFSLYTVQLAIAYSPDVFGGVRRGVENSAALAEQQRYELEASYLTLTTNVANAAIAAAGLQAQIDAYQRLVDIDRNLLALYGQEKALGQLARADVIAQEAALAQAEAQLAPLRRQLAQTYDQLAVLTGRTPAEFAHAPLHLADLTLPARLPVSLPSKLVDQRPDVRAAEANLHAASAAVGVAVAARLPSITLNANGGGASTSIGSILTNGNNFWTLAGGFAQPVFEGGQLLAKPAPGRGRLRGGPRPVPLHRAHRLPERRRRPARRPDRRRHPARHSLRRTRHPAGPSPSPRPSSAWARSPEPRSWPWSRTTASPSRPKPRPRPPVTPTP